jgi:hypothetical protein
MLPPVTALNVTDGVVSVIGVSAGSVPATAKIIGGIAVSPTGEIYAVFL